MKKILIVAVALAISACATTNNRTAMGFEDLNEFGANDQPAVDDPIAICEGPAC